MVAVGARTALLRGGLGLAICASPESDRVNLSPRSRGLRRASEPRIAFRSRDTERREPRISNQWSAVSIQTTRYFALIAKLPITVP